MPFVLASEMTCLTCSVQRDTPFEVNSPPANLTLAIAVEGRKVLPVPGLIPVLFLKLRQGVNE